MGKVSVFSLLCCLQKELEIMHHMLVTMLLFRIINDQKFMEVEAMNLTACNLVQKLQYRTEVPVT